MNYKKFQQEIHEKYLPKVQHIIDVLNSCETEEQVNSCIDWGKNLVLQWREHEDYIIDKTHGGWVACNMSMRMIHELDNLLDILILAIDRKRAEMSETEEI